MSLGFAYDSDFEPPAPIVPVAVTNGDGENQLIFPAFFDTGADRTIVPTMLVAALELAPAEDEPNLIVTTVAGSQTVQTYIITLVIGALTFNALAPAIGDELIVGRDVLNDLVVRFDGPMQRVTIEDPR